MSTKDEVNKDNANSDELAIARTVLAVERTFNAWIKTAIALLAGGFGLMQLMAGSEHKVFVGGASALLILMAMTITAYAARRYKSRMSRFTSSNIDNWPTAVVMALALGFLLVCVFVLACLFYLQPSA